MTLIDWLLTVLNPLFWGVVGYISAFTMSAGRFPWQKKPTKR